MVIMVVVVADATAGDRGGGDVDILSGLQFGSAIRFGSVRFGSSSVKESQQQVKWSTALVRLRFTVRRLGSV
ncbi:hypothetical protein Hanom_Chr07g00604191 [Helianthus anomalus]